MKRETTEKPLWYTRRAGEVRGPYPAGQISRYILLGRILETDEISRDTVQWRPVSEHPELIPTEVLEADTEEGQQRLLMARMREDERRGIDRRDGSREGTVHERRRPDRRAPETESMLRHRRVRTQVAQGYGGAESRVDWRVMLILVAVVAALTAIFVRYTPRTQRNKAQCSAAPASGVDWNNCYRPGLHAPGADLLAAHMHSMNLTGADLRGADLRGADLAYATLSLANLHGANLSDARLLGAGLRHADLRFARLTDADLSYAVLEGAQLAGAQLKGARLDHAIWVNGIICAAGSVGRCVPSGVRTTVRPGQLP